MTQQEKRIKIAETCGWTDITDDGMGTIGTDPQDGRREDIPDYFYDLNACHDMEKVVLENAGSWVRYVKEIKVQSNLVGLPHFHLPAAQRAEAFVETFKLW